MPASVSTPSTSMARSRTRRARSRISGLIGTRAETSPALPRLGAAPSEGLRGDEGVLADGALGYDPDQEREHARLEATAGALDGQHVGRDDGAGRDRDPGDDALGQSLAHPSLVVHDLLVGRAEGLLDVADVADQPLQAGRLERGGVIGA